MAESRKSDFGATIKITIKDGLDDPDLSGATSQKINVGKPDGTLSALTAAFVTDGSSGTTAVLSAAVASGLINQAGTYSVQGLVTGSGFQYRTTKGYFSASSILE